MERAEGCPGGIRDQRVIGGGAGGAASDTMAMAIGAALGGQAMAMSLRVPYPPLPVLSPTFHPAGTPARM